MKIALFHELNWGGARRTVNEFARVLSNKHTVHIYYVDGSKETIKYNNLSTYIFYQFPSLEYMGGNWKRKIYKDSIELLKLYLLHKKIAKQINKEKYDLIFIHPSKFTQAPFLLRFIKGHKVYFCQEPLRLIYDEYLNSLVNLACHKFIYEIINRKIRKWIDASNTKKADLILANSLYSVRSIKKAYGINSHLCYLGVDVNKFRPIPVKKIYDVLFIGNKTSIEGYDLFKDTVKLFKQKINIKILESNFRYAMISDEQLVLEYNRAKIVVQLSRNEPFGLIPIEAMACGVPVIAIAEGGLAESVLHGKSGFLIKRSKKELFEALSILLDKDDLRKKMGKKAREYTVANWTWEKSVSNFLEIIKNV